MLKLLLLSQLRFAWRTPFSTLSALLGLTLGIASLVSVHLICERIVASLDAAIPVHLRSVTHLATRPELRDSDYFALRQQWRQGNFTGVSALAPLLQGEVTVADRQVSVYGLDWLALAGFNSTPGAQSVGGQRGEDAVAIPAPLSDQVLLHGNLDWPPGSRAQVAGRSVAVVGTLAPAAGLDSGQALYADIALAVDLLQPTDTARLSAVLLQTHDPWVRLRRLLSRLLPGVEAGLPSVGAPRLGPAWQVRPLASEMPEQSFGRSVLFNLGALGTLSLVVAWFLMFQTALLWLRRQQRVFRLLRDQGVSVAQQFAIFCLTMLCLGVLAGLLGLALGTQLASSLMAQFATAGAAVSYGHWHSPWLLTKAAVSALAVPMLSALLAYRVALAETEHSRARHDWLRWLLCILFAALLWLFLWWQESGLFGAFAAVLMACALAVALLMPLVQWLRQYWTTPARHHRADHQRALNLRMGARELLWYPRELSAALAALALAVATSIGISTMVDSFRLDFVRMLEQRLADDVGIEGTPEQLQRLIANVRNDADVKQIHRYERARMRIEGQPVVLGRSSLNKRGAARYGLRRALSATEIMLNQRTAQAFHLAVGDWLQLPNQRLQVAHIYPGYGDAQLRALIGLQTPRLRHATNAAVAFELYRVGLESPQATAAAQRLQSLHPELNIQTRQAVRARSVAIFDQTFAITRSLTMVALLVAAVGLYSALVALGLNQSRTRTLLIYLGQSRGERLLYVCGRALAVSLVTILLAVPLGLVLAAMLCYSVNPRGFGWAVPMTLQWQAIIWPVALAFLAALAAGWMGDRREAA